MRTEAKSGSHVDVRIGEEFELFWTDHSLSGFRTVVTVPPAIERITTQKKIPSGMGGSAKFVGSFRCRSPGAHKIHFCEARPWEQESHSFEVEIDCR